MNGPPDAAEAIYRAMLADSGMGAQPRVQHNDSVVSVYHLTLA
jgi:hypothetical protein